MEIQGYPNYLIYEDGRVFSKKGKGKFLNPYEKKTGYIELRLSNKGEVKNKRLHRLIAEHYIPNPDNLLQVDHINRIKNDNRIENLRWVSPKQNCNNRKMPVIKKNLKSGHKFIAANRKYWEVNIKRRGRRCFRNITDALCYKFILLLKIKSNIK